VSDLLTTVIGNYKCSSEKQYKRKTLQQVGKELEKKMLGPFVNVSFILAMEVS
jgi:hypothetical protein